MALREIRIDGDPILRKKSRVIDRVDDRILELVEDMKETMIAAQGMGLAAPQVGVLRRVVIVMIGEELVEMINPEITYSEGNLVDVEGCLSIPGKFGMVHRPEKIKVKYMDLDGKECILEVSEYSARAVCHELDHLEGILYADKVVGGLHDVKDSEEEEE